MLLGIKIIIGDKSLSREFGGLLLIYPCMCDWTSDGWGLAPA